jgi:hypothetical protein
MQREGSRKRSVSVDGVRKNVAGRQGQSLFMTMLPVELRLKVYEFAVCDNEELWMRANEDNRSDLWDIRPERGLRGIGLLRTCKRM